MSQTNTKLNSLENNIHAGNNSLTGNSNSNLIDITDKLLNNDMILHTDNTKKNDSILNDAGIEFLETEYNSNMQQNSVKHNKLKTVNNIEIDIDNFYNFSNTNFDQSLNGNNVLKNINSNLSGKNYNESNSNNDTDLLKQITNNSTNAGSLSNNNFGKKCDDSSYLNKDTLVNRILDGNDFNNSKQENILDNYDQTMSRHSMKKNNSSKHLKEKIRSPKNSSKDLKLMKSMSYNRPKNVIDSPINKENSKAQVNINLDSFTKNLDDLLANYDQNTQKIGLLQKKKISDKNQNNKNYESVVQNLNNFDSRREPRNKNYRPESFDINVASNNPIHSVNSVQKRRGVSTQNNHRATNSHTYTQSNMITNPSQNNANY